jgi:hypothetical protein
MLEAFEGGLHGGLSRADLFKQFGEIGWVHDRQRPLLTTMNTDGGTAATMDQLIVIPVQAGIQGGSRFLDSRLRGNDG